MTLITTPTDCVCSFQVTPQSPEFIPAASRLNASPSNFQWPSGPSTTATNGGSNGQHILKPHFVNPLKSMSILGGNGNGGSSSSNSSSSATSRRFGGSGSNRNCSPESLTDSPRLTPQSSPPTTSTGQMLQENVGGTTYFYPADAAATSVVDQGTGVTQESMYQMPVHMYPGPAAHVQVGETKNNLVSTRMLLINIFSVPVLIPATPIAALQCFFHG